MSPLLLGLGTRREVLRHSRSLLFQKTLPRMDGIQPSPVAGINKKV